MEYNYLEMIKYFYQNQESCNAHVFICTRIQLIIVAKPTIYTMSVVRYRKIIGERVFTSTYHVILFNLSAHDTLMLLLTTESRTPI